MELSICGSRGVVAPRARIDLMVPDRSVGNSLNTALDVLSNFSIRGDDIDPEKLRNETEKQTLRLAQEYRDWLADAYHAYQSLEAVFGGLKRSVAELQAELHEKRQKVSETHRRSLMLLEEIERNEERSSVASSFTTQFSLSPEDLSRLQPLTPVDDGLFDVIDRLRRLEQSCRQMLTVVGLTARESEVEIFKEVAALQGSAYDKLFSRLCQDAPSSFGAPSPNVDSLTSRTFDLLRAERPDLFRLALLEVAKHRRAALSKSFLNSISGSLTMERGTHDPVRSLSDLLSAYHRAIASEVEVMRWLFSSPEGVEPVDTAVSETLDQILDAPGRLMRNNADAIVEIELSPSIAFSLLNIVHLYSVTVLRLLHPVYACSGVQCALQEYVTLPSFATVVSLPDVLTRL